MNRLRCFQRIRCAFYSNQSGPTDRPVRLSHLPPETKTNANEPSSPTGEESHSSDKLSKASEPLQSTDTAESVKQAQNSINHKKSLVRLLQETRIEDIAGPEPHTFATLLRYSKLMELGDPKNKRVVGRIFHVVGDDLYIDFGWKFHCVCKKPKTHSRSYVVGTQVLLAIKDLELSTRFLGATADLTLSEANCVLLKIISSPIKKTEAAA